jgi:hypothetical protein
MEYSAHIFIISIIIIIIIIHILLWFNYDSY